MSGYHKPAHSIDEQIATLRSRGLVIDDEVRARHYLANISYFRFSAYTRPFYQPGSTDHLFLQNTHFDDVLQLYVFDRELRLLLLDAIERIEIALRAQLGNTLAEHHGPHGYLNAAIFDTRYNHCWLLDKLERAGQARELEAFLAHYRRKYHAAPHQPPIWMAVELLTFKEVSTLFSQLRLPEDTQRIERNFGLKMPVLRSWFRSLSDLRNTCAHHGRVWNREFGSRPEMPRKAPVGWPNIPDRIETGSHESPEQRLDPRRRLYLQLVVIETLMQIVSPTSQWTERLVALLDQYPQVSRPHMGFPGHWDTEPFWREAVKNAREGERT
ncbi:Abi family protein [Halopseudomonas bauzanensis]|uniref:Abortive infection bacteriophage resistance protein n=1 Tax=Halopseudomonas bauzanensis TaxID=653930 RepID=A0A1I4MF48_9GAMM|nr:Abi family protein [Halopseudomonas bauzanensis]SES00000.1 Abortive infection bacteriophage resistance protein [Halopseudomonas bauzanensis]SFM01656.1 Abortive infection bacteriophage resistance protein [Halopseudomonas bauzanensis]